MRRARWAVFAVIVAAAFAAGVAIAATGSLGAKPEAASPPTSVVVNGGSPGCSVVTLNSLCTATLGAGVVKLRHASALACPSRVSGSRQGSPRELVYVCHGQVPAGAGSGFGLDFTKASTVFSAPSTVTVHSATITGNFTSCPDALVSLMVFDGEEPTSIATWKPTGTVTELASSATHPATLRRSQPAVLWTSCFPGDRIPSYRFDVRFTVQAPA
jgi:hypothetical protein